MIKQRYVKDKAKIPDKVIDAAAALPIEAQYFLLGMAKGMVYANKRIASHESGKNSKEAINRLE